ncbi:hypothetical protein ABIB85_004461 [Bradyrhizobium sp. JR1.5]
MALLWFHTPFDQIAAAIQMTEGELEEVFGSAIMDFCKDGPKPQKA